MAVKVPTPNAPTFQINIVVPKEFSNMGENEWKMKKIDLRSKVFTYSEGLPFYEQWLIAIAQNLKLRGDIPVAYSLNKAPATPATTGVAATPNIYPTPKAPNV